MKPRKTGFFCPFPEIFQSIPGLLKSTESPDQLLQMIDGKIGLPIPAIIVRMVEVAFNNRIGDLLKLLRCNCSRIEKGWRGRTLAGMDINPVVISPHQSKAECFSGDGGKESVVQAVRKEGAVRIMIIVEDEVINSMIPGRENFLLHDSRIGFVAVSPEGDFRLTVTGKTRTGRFDKLPFAPACSVCCGIAFIASVIVREIIASHINFSHDGRSLSK